MTFMPWSSDIAVGLNEMDEQHRWLVDCINQLHTKLSGDAPDKAAVGETLEGLMEYTVNYPGLKAGAWKMKVLQVQVDQTERPGCLNPGFIAE